jgi:hypothetical protein
MKVCISTRFDASADLVWQTVKKSSTLVFITRGLLGFTTDNFPTQWRTGETIKTRLWLYNIIPAWRHVLYFVRVDDEKREILTNESGGLIKVWNHQIRVAPESEKNCLYTDEIQIKAEVFTILVWLFAHFFYRYRQFRWRRLLRQIKNLESGKET